MLSSSASPISPSSSVVQIVPYDAEVDVVGNGMFESDFKAMCQNLEGCCDGQLLEIFPREIHNPYPLGVTLQSFELMKQVTGVLKRGIHAIVDNYNKDPRLQSLISLPPRALEVIKSVQHLPYNIGSWRPDILFPADDVSSFKICEINARFPFNAFFASHEKNNVLANLPYLQNAPIMKIHELDEIPNFFKSVYDPSKSVGILKAKSGGWDVKLFQQSYTGKRKFESETASVNSSNNLNSSNSSESSLLYRSNSLPQPPSTPKHYKDTFNTVEARFINPADLRINEVDGKLYDGEHGPFEQFAFETDQDYLLYKLDPKILDHILTKCVYINDIRTILVTHDKRLLAVLTDESIMKDYLSPEDVKILQKNVIKTYVIGKTSIELLSEIKCTKNNWLLKPNGAGKGEGIVFGFDCKSDEEWVNALEDPAHINFILQPLIKQQTFELVQAKGVKEMLVVGLLHNFNDHFFGPGIFRASLLSSPIVNVSGGNGIILSPCVISSRFPIVRKQKNKELNYMELSNNFDQNTVQPTNYSSFKHLSACENSHLRFAFPNDCCYSLSVIEGQTSIYHNNESSDSDSILSTLISSGIVKVNISDWPADEKLNDRLRQFASSIGIMNSHSSSESDVWDVRPRRHSIETSNGISDSQSKMKPARSTTAEEFPMHTDCSFEDIPPRYMLLYVVEEDRMNGGLTTLIDSTVLMRYLSKRSLAALHKYEYDMIVPPEFFKGSSTVRGRILSAGKLWRYRSDTIVRENCNEEQLAALKELDSLLENPHIILTTTLTKGTLLLLDNSRWFHGRTQIFDQNRWLKRIRFHPKNYQELEAPFARALSRSNTLGITSPEVSDIKEHSIIKSLKSNAEEVFSRLSKAIDLLLLMKSDSSLVVNYEHYIREQIKHIESLQYFMIDFKSKPFSLFRNSPQSFVVSISCIGAPFEYVILQAANSVLIGNKTELVVDENQIPTYYTIFEHLSDYISLKSDVISCNFYYNYNFLTVSSTGSIILSSLYPSINQLCVSEVATAKYLIEKYHLNNTDELMDEFDLISPENRKLFVDARLLYITKEIKRRSEFYSNLSPTDGIAHHKTNSSDVLSTKMNKLNPLNSFPVISGEDLGKSITSIMTTSKFNIAFATGGTTGSAKVVYRSTWEDQENARYIAKGLLASGLLPGSTVVNVLSSGFWGGMHVYNLALQYIGCSLLPMGSNFPFDQLVIYMRKLNPTAILAMPSFLLQFAEYLEQNNISDLRLDNAITGGEILFAAARNKIKLVLKIPDSGFLSTGYTSNETGAIGFRCRYSDEGNFHIHENMQYVYLKPNLDDIQENENNANMTYGSIITSNLNRILMPVVNYSIGDVGSMQLQSSAICGEAVRCQCGRTLKILTLKGRSDGRFRIGKCDVFVEDISKALSHISELSLNFTAQIKKCQETLKDSLELHVELREKNSTAINDSDYKMVKLEVINRLLNCCEDLSASLWTGANSIIVEPQVILYQPGTLPRNFRSGKIPLVVDLRVKS